MPKKEKTIEYLIKKYFGEHPNADTKHGPVVDYVEEKYLGLHGRKPRDTWRSIRALYEQGFLVKVGKGVYRYDPQAVTRKTLEDFTSKEKERILKRDAYKCVVCGRGKKDGLELHIDHIKPRSLGGRATIENGQTLCAQHNFIKKSLRQTETGKKMFIRLYELVKAEGNKQLKDFCTDILRTYELHDVNGHIKWKK